MSRENAFTLGRRHRTHTWKATTAGEYLSIAEAAAIASVAPQTVRRWVRAGDLNGYKAGRVLRVKRAELDAFLASSHETVSCGDLSPEGQAVRDFRRLEARKQKSRKVSLGVPASIETIASGSDRCPVCT